MLFFLCTVVSVLNTVVDMYDNNVCLQNEELISASWSGNVMTVVSLLNSGADSQTENKVHKHSFSLITVFICTPWGLFHANIFVFDYAIDNINMWDLMQLIPLDTRDSSGLCQSVWPSPSGSSPDIKRSSAQPQE